MTNTGETGSSPHSFGLRFIVLAGELMSTYGDMLNEVSRVEVKAKTHSGHILPNSVFVFGSAESRDGFIADMKKAKPNVEYATTEDRGQFFVALKGCGVV